MSRQITDQILILGSGFGPPQGALLTLPCKTWRQPGEKEVISDFFGCLSKRGQGWRWQLGVHRALAWHGHSFPRTI